MDEAADSYSTSTTPLLLLGSLTLAVSLFVLIGHGRGKARLPPGPPALLFLAKFVALRRSIFDLGPLLVDLHARHGPVISIHLFRTLIFVADRKMAHRALVQGGATFAERPPPADPVRLFSSGGRDISNSPYGPYWRLLRRNLAAEALSPARVAHFAAARRSACDGLVSGLLREQDEVVTLRPLLRRAMFELLVFMCFGARLDSEALDEVEELQHQALLSLTTFPVFSFFPAVTKRLFRRRWSAFLAVRRRQDEVFVPLIHAKRGDGDPPCYAESLLAVRVADDGRLTDAEMVSLCSEFLNGGTDTTVTLLEWIMAELVNHPDVQAKVYEEVRANPELNDLQAMPYLKAVVMEGLRLHPPGHFLLPHGVQQSGDGDVEIGGYTVPKGAEVNFLVAEIGRDETVWTAAREFRPERFLKGAEGHGVDITGSREIKMMPFGAGRRMCPGYSLGMHHAEYFVARMVRELEWRPPVDGEEVDMAETLDFTTVMKHPLRARVFART
jgi:cytochrome P450